MCLAGSPASGLLDRDAEESRGSKITERRSHSEWPSVSDFICAKGCRAKTNHGGPAKKIKSKPSEASRGGVHFAGAALFRSREGSKLYLTQANVGSITKACSQAERAATKSPAFFFTRPSQ